MQERDKLNEASEQSIQNDKGEAFEEPEGRDYEESLDWGEYPIDSLLIRSEPRSVFEVVRRINDSKYILNPDFQRDFIWDEIKQSRLIESALMRIPLPVFYLAETDDGRVIVVDGLQRLMTFNRYLENKLSLRGLTGPAASLNGSKFEDLIPKYQTRIEDTSLVLYLIDSKVPDKARLDIFERVNSGVPLSRQQMRNCLYVGEATRWLQRQAKSEWFLRTTTRSLNPKTMRDRELINRFCGFYLLGVGQYKGDMDAFLARTLEHMNKMGKDQVEDLSDKFELSMDNNWNVFKGQAFRKHTDPRHWRSVINASLFDVFSVVMTKIDEQTAKNRTEDIRQIFYELMEDEKFMQSITISTNSLIRVKARFEIIERVFGEF